MLVYFWASWRSVCRLQQGTIENIARDRDVVTVALRSGDMGAVQRHLAGHALTFPVLNDPHGAYAAQSGGDALPALAVGGRVARLGAQHSGFRPDSKSCGLASLAISSGQGLWLQRRWSMRILPAM